MVKTIRLIAPDWQGGNKHAYYFGAELLSWLAPKNDNQKEIKLDIEQPKNEELEKENGVVAQSSVKRNVSMAARSEERRVGKEGRSRWWPRHEEREYEET